MQEKNHKQADDRNRREAIVFLTAGVLMLITELWKQYALTFYIYEGKFCLSFIPFQLCSIAMYISIVLGAVGNHSAGIRDILLEFLADFSLLGGALAFLDTSGMHYELYALTVHSYLWHIGLIALGIYAGTRRRRKDAHTFLGAAGLYLLCCAVAEIINLSLDRYDFVNMFYINPHYRMVQIVFSDLAGYISNIAVIVLYIILTICGAFMFHVIWNIMRNK